MAPVPICSRSASPALWTSAATMATIHGVGPVARTLRRDYHKLKRQVPQASPAVWPSAAPAFVELRPLERWPRAAAGGRLELSDPAGIKLTVELPAEAASLVGLAQALWRRR
jgi:hypothetical protein